MTERIAVEAVDTDLGPMTIASSSRGVVAVVAGRDEATLVAGIGRRLPDTPIVAQPCPDAPWLVAWAAGERRDHPPLDLRGLAPFDAAVYRFVANLAWGERATYGDVAVAIGRPGAARAVGAAMRRCPLFPAVPCHRVVRAVDGWSGWGGEDAVKRRLLAREG